MTYKCGSHTSLASLTDREVIYGMHYLCTGYAVNLISSTPAIIKISSVLEHEDHIIIY